MVAGAIRESGVDVVDIIGWDYYNSQLIFTHKLGFRIVSAYLVFLSGIVQVL